MPPAPVTLKRVLPGADPPPGVLTAQLINYGTGKMADNGWRISLAAFGLPSLLVLMWSPFLPDTPGSLLSRGKQKEAKRTLEVGNSTGHRVLQGAAWRRLAAARAMHMRPIAATSCRPPSHLTCHACPAVPPPPRSGCGAPRMWSWSGRIWLMR